MSTVPVRILIASPARGRVELHRKEIAAASTLGPVDAEYHYDLADSPDRFSDSLDSTQVVILNSRGISAEAIARAPKLRFVQKLGVDVSHLAVEAFRDRGIAVSVLPDMGHVAVAEHTLAMAFAGTRNLVASHIRILRRENPKNLEVVQTTQDVRQVNWLDLDSHRFPLVRDLTLGLVGFGEIAREVARLARPLFRSVIYTKRRRLSEADEQQYGVSFRAADHFYQEADVISLHATLKDGEPPIVDADAIARFKSNAFFINTSRGNQVDQRALVQALKSNRIRGAALDVFAHEPVFDEELLSCPNVALTPHTAIMLPLGRRFSDALANTRTFLEGGTPQGLIPAGN